MVRHLTEARCATRLAFSFALGFRLTFNAYILAYYAYLMANNVKSYFYEKKSSAGVSDRDTMDSKADF